MRIIIFSIFLFVTSCNNKVTTDASIVLSKLTGKHNFKTINDTINYSYHKTYYKVVVEKYFDTNVPHKIFGYLSDSPSLYGNYFKFDIHGKLEKYYFMAGDAEHDLYRVIFNTDRNEYEELGNAYVDYFAPHNLKDTANNYKLIFSTFPRKQIDVSYSIDLVNYKKLLLTEQLPFIVECDVVLTKKEIEQGIYIKVKTQNLAIKLIGLDNEKETIDTLYFKN